MEERLIVIVIGRNEGPRLGKSITSALCAQPKALIYVDSGSTDGSPEIARKVDPSVLVHELDPQKPFTAARGRNEGYEILRAKAPHAEFVQFLDGDCVLDDGWTAYAMRYLDEHPDVGVVTGRLREEYRDKNIYHRLADMEWAAPPGEVQFTGGICMMRIEAFTKAGGFDPAIVAGEELNLALRIREKGYRLMRVAQDMATHDIHMERFSEWWRRSRRYGHSSAEGFYLSGMNDAHRRRELTSMLAWGAALPAAAVGLALPTLGLSLGLLGGYSVLYKRVRAYRLEQGDSDEDARIYALAAVLGKIAAVGGIVDFSRRILKGEIKHGQSSIRA